MLANKLKSPSNRSNHYSTKFKYSIPTCWASLRRLVTMAEHIDIVSLTASPSSLEAEVEFWALLEQYPECAFPYFEGVARGRYLPCAWCRYCFNQSCKWDCQVCPIWYRESLLLNNPDSSPPVTPPAPPPIVSDDTEITVSEVDTSDLSSDSDWSDNAIAWAEEEEPYPYESDDEASTHGLDWTLHGVNVEGSNDGEPTVVFDLQDLADFTALGPANPWPSIPVELDSAGNSERESEDDYSDLD